MTENSNQGESGLRGFSVQPEKNDIEVHLLRTFVWEDEWALHQLVQSNFLNFVQRFSKVSQFLDQYLRVQLPPSTPR